jgi:thaumarchaeosortase
MSWKWRKLIGRLTLKIKKIINMLPRLLLFISFLIPMIILYCIEPYSFEKTWKGRTYYIFFLWLLLLEILLSWDELDATKLKRIKSPRTIAFIITLSIPTIYVIVANFYGLNLMIRECALQNLHMGDYWANNMPLCIEYLVFSAIFIVTVFFQYGTVGLKHYSIAPTLLAIIGSIYTIDNFYPEGTFTPFQIIVPTTVILAAQVLNMMGYQTIMLSPYKGMPTLLIRDSQGRSSLPFAVAWPCSGIDSLLLYSVTVLLFLKRNPVPTLHKLIYFMVGAVVTYFINILRIATIYIISIDGGDWLTFHDLYGPLYSVSWIVSYPLIMFGIEALLTKIKDKRTLRQNGSHALSTDVIYRQYSANPSL